MSEPLPGWVVAEAVARTGLSADTLRFADLRAQGHSTLKQRHDLPAERWSARHQRRLTLQVFAAHEAATVST